MFLPCMQTSMPGKLHYPLKFWKISLKILILLKIYMSNLCIVKHILKVEISIIALVLVQDLKKLENFLFFSEFDFQRAFPFTVEICVNEKVSEGKADRWRVMGSLCTIFLHFRCNERDILRKLQVPKESLWFVDCVTQNTGVWDWSLESSHFQKFLSCMLACFSVLILLGGWFNAS